MSPIAEAQIHELLAKGGPGSVRMAEAIWEDATLQVAMVLCPECSLPVPHPDYVGHFHDHAVLKGAK